MLSRRRMRLFGKKFILEDSPGKHMPWIYCTYRVHFFVLDYMLRTKTFHDFLCICPVKISMLCLCYNLFMSTSESIDDFNLNLDLKLVWRVIFSKWNVLEKFPVCSSLDSETWTTLTCQWEFSVAMCVTSSFLLLINWALRNRYCWGQSANLDQPVKPFTCGSVVFQWR